jgi:hypothetical protein
MMVKPGDPRAYTPDQARSRNATLRRYYGITLEEYIELFDRQDGRCAICGREPKSRALHVDHSHKTGDVRGLLCWTCNKALRFIHDDPLYATDVAKYLTSEPFRRGTAVQGPAKPSAEARRRYRKMVAKPRCEHVIQHIGKPAPCALAKGHKSGHRRTKS